MVDALDLVLAEQGRDVVGQPVGALQVPPEGLLHDDAVPTCMAHAGLVDVFGDSLIDSWGQGQVGEAVGLCALVKGFYVAVKALVGGSVIILAGHVGVAGKKLLQLGLLLRGSFEEGLALLADVSHCKAGAGVAHDVGVFGQKAIPEQPPDGGVDLLLGQVL